MMLDDGLDDGLDDDVYSSLMFVLLLTMRTMRYIMCDNDLNIWP